MRRKSIVWLCVLGAALTLILVAAAPALDALWFPPDFLAMRSAVVVPIKKADGSPGTRRVGPHALGWVKLKHISEFVVSAVLSTEDAAFFSHEGIDFYELKQAIKKDLEEKRFARGASTLTQQVVKNTFLSQEKTLTRKIKEVLWAWQMEKQLTKFEILNFYLNLVEWGPGIYGIEQAAYRYFGRSPSNLSAKQAAFLALLLPSPVRYSAYHARRTLTPWAAQRINHILKIMYGMKFIDEATYRQALEESLWGEKPSSETDANPQGEDSELPAIPMPVPVAAPVLMDAQEPSHPAPSGQPPSPTIEESEGGEKSIKSESSPSEVGGEPELVPPSPNSGDGSIVPK